MSLPKLLGLLSLLLFGIIGVMALFKEPAATIPSVPAQVPLEVELDQEIQTVMPAVSPAPATRLRRKGCRSDDRTS